MRLVAADLHPYRPPQPCAVFVLAGGHMANCQCRESATCGSRRGRRCSCAPRYAGRPTATGHHTRHVMPDAGCPRRLLHLPRSHGTQQLVEIAWALAGVCVNELLFEHLPVVGAVHRPEHPDRSRPRRGPAAGSAQTPRRGSGGLGRGHGCCRCDIRDVDDLGALRAP